MLNKFSFGMKLVRTRFSKFLSALGHILNCVHSKSHFRISDDIFSFSIFSLFAFRPFKWRFVSTLGRQRAKIIFVS